MGHAGQWKPGQSGNPKGRPPSERALTRILERALSRTIPDPDDPTKKVARKRVMARLLAEAASEGMITFPDGRVEMLKPEEWLDFCAKVLKHVDGDKTMAQVDANLSGSVNLIWTPHKPE